MLLASMAGQAVALAFRFTELVEVSFIVVSDRVCLSCWCSVLFFLLMYDVGGGGGSYSPEDIGGGIALLVLTVGHILSSPVRFPKSGGIFSSCRIGWSLSLWLVFPPYYFPCPAIFQIPDFRLLSGHLTVVCALPWGVK